MFALKTSACHFDFLKHLSARFFKKVGASLKGTLHWVLLRKLDNINDRHGSPNLSPSSRRLLAT